MVINRAKFDACTSSSFRGVKTDRQTDRIALYILYQGCEKVIQIFVLISKKNKKVNTCNFSRDFKIGLGHVMNLSHVKYFRGARTYQDILGMRAITKVENHCIRYLLANQ